MPLGIIGDSALCISFFPMRSFGKKWLNYAAPRTYGLSIQFVFMRCCVERQDGRSDGVVFGGNVPHD